MSRSLHAGEERQHFHARCTGPPRAESGAWYWHRSAGELSGPLNQAVRVWKRLRGLRPPSGRPPAPAPPPNSKATATATDSNQPATPQKRGQMMGIPWTNMSFYALSCCLIRTTGGVSAMLAHRGSASRFSTREPAYADALDSASPIASSSFSSSHLGSKWPDSNHSPKASNSSRCPTGSN